MCSDERKTHWSLLTLKKILLKRLAPVEGPHVFVKRFIFLSQQDSGSLADSDGDEKDKKKKKKKKKAKVESCVHHCNIVFKHHYTNEIVLHIPY